VVSAEIAEALNAPLDLLLVRKIGVPFQPELAMGAVVDGGHPYIIRDGDVIALADISADDFDRICEFELAEIVRRRKLYLADRPRAPVKDRVVIVLCETMAVKSSVRRNVETGKPTLRPVYGCLPVDCPL